MFFVAYTVEDIVDFTFSGFGIGIGVGEGGDGGLDVGDDSRRVIIEDFCCSV